MDRLSGFQHKLFSLSLKFQARNMMAADIKMIFCVGLVGVLTGVGKSALIGKSHSKGRDDLVLQYVVNNSLREHPVLTKLRLAGVENKIDVRHQIAMKTLNELAAGEAGTYDFVFIDADKFNYDRYYEKSLELIRKGGIIAIDNVLWSGKVVNPDPSDLTSQGLDALNKKLHKDHRIELSMLTVGDGLTIAIKR